MAHKKFDEDDPEIASAEEMDEVAFGEPKGEKKKSRNDSRSVSRK
jgi:hypothetical protein